MDSEKQIETLRRTTAKLTRKALRLGFVIPRNPGWWFENEGFYDGKTIEEIELIGSEYLLTDDGVAGASGLIRAKMGEVWDRRIRLTCQVITALIGLVGALIGVLAIIYK